MKNNTKNKTLQYFGKKKYLSLKSVAVMFVVIGLSSLFLFAFAFSADIAAQEEPPEEVIPALTINSRGNVGIGTLDSRYNCM